jgi:acyl carrier protein
VNGIAGFVAILQDELGLSVTQDDVGKSLDRVAGWDSVHLLELLAVLERETGRHVSLPDALTASSLAEIYACVADGNG